MTTSDPSLSDLLQFELGALELANRALKLFANNAAVITAVNHAISWLDDFEPEFVAAGPPPVLKMPRGGLLTLQDQEVGAQVLKNEARGTNSMVRKGAGEKEKEEKLPLSAAAVAALQLLQDEAADAAADEAAVAVPAPAAPAVAQAALGTQQHAQTHPPRRKLKSRYDNL